MSYEFIRLSEVEQIESSHNANLLIEENGEIKRLPIDSVFSGQQHVQADWNETDDTSPSYIANKPNLTGNSVIKYTIDCGGQMYLNGEAQTIDQILDVWESGATMRVAWTDNSASVFPIVNVRYEMMCGSMQCRVEWISNGYIGGYTII